MSLEKSDFLEFYSELKEYFNTRYNLILLQSSEKAANILSAAIVYVIIFTVALLIILFGSISAALYLSDYFNSLYKGFLAVSVIYFSIFIIILLFKRTIIKKLFVNMFIRQFFSNVD